jgi:phosphate transport system permease protein
LVSFPEPAEIARGFGAACVLLVLVLLLFAIARAVGGRGPGQLSPGQQRRRALASRRDLARYQRVDAMRAAEAAEYEYEFPEEEA